MKRFLTVNEKDAEIVLKLIRNAAIANMTRDAYEWIKRELQNSRVAHNDQNASHHNELPHQRGYSSFYIDQSGQWMRVNH